MFADFLLLSPFFAKIGHTDMTLHDLLYMHVRLKLARKVILSKLKYKCNVKLMQIEFFLFIQKDMIIFILFAEMTNKFLQLTYA